MKPKKEYNMEPSMPQKGKPEDTLVQKPKKEYNMQTSRRQNGKSEYAPLRLYRPVG